MAFRDHDSGLKLHYASLTSTGEPETDKSNNPLVSLTGIGPEVHLDVFGTGFLASDDGQILTNHHVAEPWWQNSELKEMLDQGLVPEIAEMTAYFPGITHGIPISTKKISSVADVAVLKGNVSGLGIRRIALADSRHSAVDGSPVVLLGYPTGVDAILAWTGAATLQAIAASSKGDPKQKLLLCELLPHEHLACRTQRHEMKGCLAQIDANRMNLHADDPPIRSCHHDPPATQVNQAVESRCGAVG